MKRWWRERRPFVLGRLATGLIKFVGSTLRVRVEGVEHLQRHPSGKVICGWHGKSFIPAYIFRRKGVWVVISHSRDGEVQNQVFSRLGFCVIRGSTGRGGVRAAVESIRALREGATMAITPDGPRGPSGVVQGGVMLMAQKSGAALVPVGIGARPAWRAPSWDRYMVPLPFARALVIYGEPVLIPATAGEEEVEALRLRLERSIQELDERAERGA